MPLFLGGHHAVENLERTDLSVYWHLSGQLLQGTTEDPPETKISGIFMRRLRK